MKLNSDEFKEKYKEKLSDNQDLLIEILEDVTDSINNTDEINKLNEEISKKDEEINDLKQKYIDRFYEVDDDKTKTPEPVAGLEEKKVIDIREI